MQQRYIEECDTLFYQGMSSSQTQALKYVGNQKIRATTGEMMWCTGRNNFSPLKAIYRLHIGEEIADVNLQPFSSYTSMLNPINVFGSAISWVSNRLNGFHFSPSENPSAESVVFHAPIISKLSIGQLTDIESHQKKYQHWLQRNDRTQGLILYSVSRGTATTFCAFAKAKYPEVRLAIFEGAIDSVPNVLSQRAINKFKFNYIADKAISVVSSCLSHFTQYKPGGISPLASVADYPENVPTVFITSKIDTEVPFENTNRLANALAARGKNDVYLLKLNKSSHPNYMFDDKDDRDSYEAFIHAIYRKYNLKYDLDLADKGEALLSGSSLVELGRENNHRLMPYMHVRSTPTIYSGDHKKQQILNNLKALRVNEECAERIMNAVENMPGKDHIEGALIFLTQVADKNGKRENYYRYSNYIAEYFCTISNLGLFAVGCYYGDFALLVAATFSALSHAIPSQRLHDLDILGVFIVFGKVITNCNIFIEKPEVLAWGAGALTINLMDTIITRKYLDKIGPVIHVAWHLAAALALYKLNQAQVDVTNEELQSITSATKLNTIPEFLNTAFEEITKQMSHLFNASRCTIC